MSQFSYRKLYTYFLLQDFTFTLHTTLKKPIAFLIRLLSRLFFLVGLNSSGLRLFLKARRVANTSGSNDELRNILERQDAREILERLLPELPKGIEAADLSSRVLILKLPVVTNQIVSSRGVLIIKFTETFSLMYQLIDVDLLAKYFDIVLEPSWVGYGVAEILIWNYIGGNNRIVVQAGYHDDFDLLSSLNNRLIPSEVGPADWVDGTTFKARGDDVVPKYDCIYVASYHKPKRVDRYLRALVNVGKVNPDFKPALVCAGHGSYKDYVDNAIEWAKVHINLQTFPGMTQAELSEIIRSSKVNVLTSLREGSNKGLAEGMWCNVPALIISECVSGNHRHINEATGYSVPDSKLEKKLAEISNSNIQASPRRWVEQNIAPQISTRKLENCLYPKGDFQIGALFVKTNSPEMRYVRNDLTHFSESRGEFLYSVSKATGSEENLLRYMRSLEERTATSEA